MNMTSNLQMVLLDHTRYKSFVFCANRCTLKLYMRPANLNKRKSFLILKTTYYIQSTVTYTMFMLRSANRISLKGIQTAYNSSVSVKVLSSSALSQRSFHATSFAFSEKKVFLKFPMISLAI